MTLLLLLLVIGAVVWYRRRRNQSIEPEPPPVQVQVQQLPTLPVAVPVQVPVQQSALRATDAPAAQPTTPDIKSDKVPPLTLGNEWHFFLSHSAPD